MIESFAQHTPRLGQEVFVAESALVLGDVVVGDRSSVWYGAVVRGDVHRIRIGARTNIQDRTVIHVSTGTHPVTVGDLVTVGHGAVVHGCTVEERVLVGIGAIILDGAVVGQGSVVAAGALLPPGKVYPPRSLIVGAPAVRKREVSEDEIQWILRSAEHYVDLAALHRQIPLNS